MKKKVLMVCLGNICRSPLAEGLLRSKVDKDLVEVDSAGTSNYHPNKPPDPRSIESARINGIDISGLRARQFKTEDFKEFDLIYIMDDSNYEDIMELARNDEERNKVDYILNEIYPGENLSVPDPYFGGPEGFKNVYDLLNRSTEAIAKKLS